MRIVILGGKLESWGGGIDFLAFLIRGLMHNPEHEYTLLLRANPPSFLPRFIVKNTRFFLRPLERVFPNPNTQPFMDISPRLRIVASADRDRALDRLRPDLVIPCADEGVNHPFVGYIYDCQHRHIPELFVRRESEERDRLFSSLVARADVLLVNSKETMRDVDTFYGPLRRPIRALPFTPLLEASWLEDRRDLLTPWRLPDRYFIVSNQFWKHKDHATAFRAMALLDGPDLRKIHLVCTGKTEDYRVPGYFQELRALLQELKIEDRVHFTGYIDKRAQIEMLKHSVAVIQPTRCEGGPGGGVAYSARALGLPIILSDIPVNREIPEENGVSFFPVGDAESLAREMTRLAGSERHPTDHAVLTQNHEARLQALSDALHEIIRLSGKPTAPTDKVPRAPVSE